MSTPNPLLRGDLSDRYADMLDGLPALLDVARTILVVAFPTGHQEADDLRRRVEECAVDAHRLLLRQRTEVAEGGPRGGLGPTS